MKTPINPQFITDFLKDFVTSDILPILSANFAELSASNGESAKRKSDCTFVTEGEKEAEDLIRQGVKKQFPDVAVIGEEGGGTYEDCEFAIIIDPVDGTREMIASAKAASLIGGFGLTIGLTKNKQPEAGLIFELQPNAKGQLALTNTYSTLPNAPDYDLNKPFDIYCTNPGIMFEGYEPQFKKLQNTANKVITELNCIGFIKAATTKNTAVIEADLGLHDIAAVLPIIRSAGLTISDFSSAPIDMHDVSKKYQIVAAPKTLHTQLIELLK